MRIPNQAIVMILRGKIHNQVLYSARNAKEKSEFVCTCCHRMLFEKIVLKFKEEHYDFANITV